VDFSSERVSAYLAVLQAAPVQEKGGGRALVTPGAAATIALGALLEQITLPPGTLHSSQEVRAHRPLPADAETVCRASVSNRSSRGGTTFLTLDFSLSTPAGEVALDGSATLLVPES
jgi:hypothetical protein